MCMCVEAFLFFFFTKVVGKLLPCGASPRATPCPGRSCCSPCALVEPFVTVFSSQPLALPDRTVHSCSLPPPLVPLPETYSRRFQQLLHRDITGTPFLIEHAIFSTSNFELLRFEHRAFLSEERTYAATWNSVNSFKNKRIDYCYYYDRDRSLRFAKKYCPKEP